GGARGLSGGRRQILVQDRRGGAPLGQRRQGGGAHHGDRAEPQDPAALPHPLVLAHAGARAHARGTIAAMAAPERAQPPAAPAEPPVTRWLRGASPLSFSLYAATAAFVTYFCMYSYRKAF